MPAGGCDQDQCVLSLALPGTIVPVVSWFGASEPAWVRRRPTHEPPARSAAILAAVDVLKKYGLYDRVAGKIVWGENISQAAQFAFTGNAEIGFIALSLALAPDMKGKGKHYAVPCPPIEQACVLIKGWERNGEAARFMKYVLSPKCNPLWEEYGYSKAK